MVSRKGKGKKPNLSSSSPQHPIPRQCRFLMAGTCNHGWDGRKEWNGVKICPKPHSTEYICRPYMDQGKGEKGCQITGCTLIHVKVCPQSLLSRTCTNAKTGQKCKDGYHLRGTKAPKPLMAGADRMAREANLPGRRRTKPLFQDPSRRGHQGGYQSSPQPQSSPQSHFLPTGANWGPLPQGHQGTGPGYTQQPPQQGARGSQAGPNSQGWSGSPSPPQDSGFHEDRGRAGRIRETGNYSYPPPQDTPVGLGQGTSQTQRGPGTLPAPPPQPRRTNKELMDLFKVFLSSQT